MRNFDFLGVMIDCSRNAVKKPESLHEMIDILSSLGYNALMLYTEDTYEVEGEPYFGYLRGRYTQEELRSLDEYARGKGIELIPCIQTLAHLNALFHWDAYRPLKDWDDILTVGEERTYELIEHMLASLRKCFSSRRIHIGMDEAYMVGLGKYREKNGIEDRFLIMQKHLKKVCEIADKYGFEPMIWNDMFYQLSQKSPYSAQQIREMAPKNMPLVYWDYYHLEIDDYRKRIKANQEICSKVVFAGGAWCWHGLTPFNDFSIRATKSALKACIECGVREAFITLWGDDGAECSMYSVLPVLTWAAALADREDVAEEDVKKLFASACGESYDDFLLLDLPNKIGCNRKNWENPSKYMLFSDPFLGYLDYTVGEGDAEQYAGIAKQLHEAAGRSKNYARLFETSANLCEVLALKCDLGIRTRAAYQANDKDGALKLAKDVYPECVKRIEVFAVWLDKLWNAENKPHGMDVQDLRIGGIKERLNKCANRLISWAKGEAEKLPELEEELLPVVPYKGKGEPIISNLWSYISTINVLSHNCK